MWTRLKSWWRAEGDLVRLRGMGDRLLADMGLERESLDDLVHGRVQPTPMPPDRILHPLRGPLTWKRNQADPASL